MLQRFLIAAVLVTTAVHSTDAGVVNVLTLDASRTIDFSTNSGFGTVRGDLLNPTLFGPSGVVKSTVNMLGSVSSITPSALATANVVVFVATPGSPSGAELSALQSFVTNGGGLFVFGNNINAFASLVGGTGGAIPGASGNATVTAASSPLTQGPFGVLPAGTQFALPYHGVYASAGPAGVVGLTAPSGAFGMSYQIGLGHVVVIGDEEIFLSSSPGLPAAPILSATTRTIFRNAFASVIPTATVPEPATLASAGLGILSVVGAFTRRKARTN